ncbi:MAG: hypothetical protein ACRC8S_21655 [Fimbriiglobus sp.]
MARRRTAPKTQEDTPVVQPAIEEKPELVAPADNGNTEFPYGALAPSPAEAVSPAVTLSPLTVPTTPHIESKPGTRPHIRSWSRDLVLGYQILTDDRLKLIVLRFDERPADTVLAMVKDMGFKYRELREHGRVWVTPNDWEGRTLTDQLEQQLYRYRTGLERSAQGVA